MLRKVIVAGLVSALLAAVPAGQARADDQSYLRAINEAGFFNSGGTGVELAVGYEICAEIGEGISGRDIAEHLYYTTPLSQYGAVVLVMIAVANLCPSFMGSEPSGSRTKAGTIV